MKISLIIKGSLTIVHHHPALGKAPEWDCGNRPYLACSHEHTMQVIMGFNVLTVGRERDLLELRKCLVAVTSSISPLRIDGGSYELAAMLLLDKMPDAAWVRLEEPALGEGCEVER